MVETSTQKLGEKLFQVVEGKKKLNVYFTMNKINKEVKRVTAKNCSNS